MPQLDEKDLRSAALKHKSRLSQKQESPEEALDQVRRTSNDVFGQDVVIGRPTPFSKVSRRACLENPRKGDGALGFILNGTRDPIMNFGRHVDILIGMRYCPRGGVIELRADCDIVTAINHHRTKSEKFGENVSHVKFIFEPLKIRSITKSSLQNNALYPEVQKGMWRKLQKFEQFQLTGRKVEVTDLNRIWSQFHSRWASEDVFWVSGDYSAATDNIHMDATSAALDGITSDPITYSLMRENLCGQRIRYDDSLEIEEFQQERGQLMGSLFSFPILCLINLAIFRWAFEEWVGHEVQIKELPVLINGDDILFPAIQGLLESWEKKIGQVGFKKSLGKNFASERFAMINSTFFRRTQVRVDGGLAALWEPTPFLNMSFLYGIKKGTESDDERDQTYNDRLWNLRGAFRDWQGEDIEDRAMRQRWLDSISKRRDVTDCHFCAFDLGLDSEVPRDPLGRKQFLFMRETAKRIERGQPLNDSRLSFGLERLKGDCERPDISRSWRSFAGRYAPRTFTCLRALLSSKLRKIEGADLDRQFAGEPKKRFGCDKAEFQSGIKSAEPGNDISLSKSRFAGVASQ
jgi:hypothetical protein